jgi:hypothetical protein
MSPPRCSRRAKCHPEDGAANAASREHVDASRSSTDDDVAPRALKDRTADFFRAARVLFESIRTREGFFLCEITNPSGNPAFVFVQLNKSGFYGGSGFMGFVIRFVSALFRSSHLSMGH